MNTYLRTAAEEDVDLLFEWANDPLVRQNSFITKEIAYEEHKRWFQNLQKDPKRRQYIYMQEEEAIGQARVELDKETARISYSVRRDKRKMGFGTLLLREVCVKAKQDFPEIRTFAGEVKPDNFASQKAFLSAGFQEKKYTFEVSADKFDFGKNERESENDRY